jgi:uncharacterized membrane protein (DUF2068 family)
MSKAPAGLRAVALIELVKGVLVLISAGLIIGLLDNDFQSASEALVNHFHMNPARHDPQIFVKTLRDFGDAHKLVLSVGAICYAAVRFIEAYGLWHARVWAWGFGIMSGGLYIPVELVELSKRLSWPGVTVLIVNVFIVLLLWRSKARIP